MAKYKLDLHIHADNEHEAKAFYDATKHIGLGGSVTLASAGNTEYWTVNVNTHSEEYTLQELKELIEQLESIEATL